jgi:hypothetical protein
MFARHTTLSGISPAIGGAFSWRPHSILEYGDQDALGLVGQLLDRFSPAYVPRPKDPDNLWDRSYVEASDEIPHNSILTL